VSENLKPKKDRDVVNRFVDHFVDRKPESAACSSTQLNSTKGQAPGWFFGRSIATVCHCVRWLASSS
jgi:hypothetical protein